MCRGAPSNGRWWVLLREGKVPRCEWEKLRDAQDWGDVGEHEPGFAHQGW